MKKLKYFNILLLSTLVIGFVGCGDADERSEQKSETVTKKEQNSEPFLKKYALESGKILYEITGSMDIMGSTSKTTGTKKLIFSKYGSYELTELNKTEEQNMMGNLKTVKNHTLDYIKEATLYKVDFEKKNIQRMQVPALAMMMGTGKENMLEKGQKMLEGMGGKKVGTDKVLGYECEVWSLMGSKQCIYKGIPLKVETNIMGVKNLEVATKIEFDVAIDKDDYKLPDFPVMNVLTSATIEPSKLADMDAQDKKDAITNAQRLGELGKTLAEGQKRIEANPNMSEQEQKEVMMDAINNSKGVQSQLEKQKEMMPKIITLMKSYSQCLQDANSKSDAQTCEREGEALAKKIGLDEEFTEEDEEDERAWTKEGRATIITELNQEIKMIESTLPCIQSANNIIELMNCSQ